MLGAGCWALGAERWVLSAGCLPAPGEQWGQVGAARSIAFASFCPQLVPKSSHSSSREPPSSLQGSASGPAARLMALAAQNAAPALQRARQGRADGGDGKLPGHPGTAQGHGVWPASLDAVAFWKNTSLCLLPPALVFLLI